MAIRNEALDIVYAVLKKYIQESLNETSSPYCDVKTESQSPISKNLIVLDEINNRTSLSTTRHEETISSVSFEINIYCPNDSSKEEDGELILISKKEQARELRKLVDEVLSGYYRLNRYFCQPTPNIDNTVYRITMRYSGKINDNRLKFLV